MIAFLSAHAVLILSVLLGVSEMLALLIPGAGGFLAGLMAILKQLGAKDPQDPPAA